ncbi:hypothetical protein ACSNN9_02545 [Micromonospora sp. URMC 107]|uniref:hypothetical protein n=1 Tax=Micromonospora sp. URMC 107 TaxID=3423418 RepID=UPI003F1BEFF2
MYELIGDAEETAYDLLLERPGATLAELAAMWSGPGRLSDALARLEAAGLIGVQPGTPPRYTASATDVVAGLLQEREAVLDRTHDHFLRLTEAYRDARADVDPRVVEVVRGRRAVQQAVNQVQRSARRELCCFDKPPYVHLESTAATDRELLAAGVQCRCIYDRAAVEESGGLPTIEELIRTGQQARVLPDLPMKMYIADDQQAILPMQPGPIGQESAIIVHPSALLDALRTLFDSLWRRAVPLHLPADRGGGEGRSRSTEIDDGRLVVLLLSGLTDEAIARQIGVGYRTVQRRIATLMSDLGARTRFQAGVQAAFRQTSPAPQVPAGHRCPASGGDRPRPPAAAETGGSRGSPGAE